MLFLIPNIISFPYFYIIYSDFYFIQYYIFILKFCFYFMFNLFFQDEEKNFNQFFNNNLVSIDNKSVSNFEKIYEEFNIEFSKFINYHLLKIAANSNNNQILNEHNNPNFNINDYIKSFIIKFIKIYDLNYKYNINNPIYDFINLNIASNLSDDKTDREYIYLLFFKIFEQQIKKDDLDSKENVIFINEILEKLKFILINVSKFYKKGNLEEIVLTIFYERFLNSYIKMIFKNYSESKFKNTNTITEFLLYFLPFYENIIQTIFLFYFKEISYVNKENLFIDKLISNLLSLSIVKDKNKEKEHLSKEIEIISNLFKEKKQFIILKLLSLLNNDINMKNYFINIILNGIEQYLLSSLKTQQNSIDKFVILKEIENSFFNEVNIEFFFKDYKISNEISQEENTIHNIFKFPSIIKKYHNIIFDVLSKQAQKTLNEIFVQGFDEIMRDSNSNLNEEKTDMLFSYFDIIPEYEGFEWLYIHSLINRCVDEVFDYMKEKSFIQQVDIYSREKSSYSYRLQTLINNIKVKILRKDKKNDFDMHLTLLPFHCYHLFNLKCKPIINIKLEKIFKNFIIENQYPQNSTLIFQQGYIEFTINDKYKKDYLKGICIRSDNIQYSILSFIGINKKNFEDIKNKINLSDDLGRFLLNEMVKKNILEYEENKDSYILSKKIQNNNIEQQLLIDIRVNYFTFCEGKYDYNLNLYHKKINEKYKKTIWNCYIVKYLKKNNDKKNKINEIFDYLQQEVPLIAKIELEIKSLETVLNELDEKGFIKKITEKKNNSNIIYYKYL